MHDQQVNILDLVKILRDDTTGLIRDEVALAKTEIGEKVATASRNVGYLAVGALVAYAGLIFLLVAVSFILRAIALKEWPLRSNSISKVSALDRRFACELLPPILPPLLSRIHLHLCSSELATKSHSTSPPQCRCC
jgi:Putative Actinobacterial Holin-X, holin superfamily III